jgi:hypothetical protein
MIIRSAGWKRYLNRQYEEAFVNGLTEFRGAKVVNTIISDGIAAVEWWFDYTHKDSGNPQLYTGSGSALEERKIVEEKFYYNS